MSDLTSDEYRKRQGSVASIYSIEKATDVDVTFEDADQESHSENDDNSSSTSIPATRKQSIPKERKQSVNMIKKAPPEKPEAIRMRSWVLASFWLIAILLGLPLWYATTTIYRAPLPLAEMQSWSEGRACKAEFPLLVEVEAPSLPDAETLLKTVQHALDDANDFATHKPHHLRLRLATKKSKAPLEDGKQDSTSSKKSRDEVGENVACLLRLIPSSQKTFDSTVHSSSRVIEIHYPNPQSSSQSGPSGGLAKFVAETLEDIFWQEQELIEHLLLPQSNPSSSPSSSQSSQSNEDSLQKKHSLKKSSSVTTDINRRMSRVVKYSSNYHLTFSLFTATSSPSSWEIEQAISQYLTPLMTALSSISNFTISTQVQYYASISPFITPLYNEETKSWVLRKEDLSSFINSAEWPLASISKHPNLNFILYIPHPDMTPLTIPSSMNNNSFLLPQWGGVALLNTESKTNHLSTESLKPILETFATHLLALLGAPPHPASLQIRLDSLTRQRSAEVLVSASQTLGSLYRLVLALPSISIPTTVQNSVKITIDQLSSACEELSKGRFKRALDMGKIANEEAEKAFFERTMVAQVYFPDEHKVAVYLPLLGPVAVPLVMGLVREIKRVLAGRRRVVA